jgi:hypothetical protein
MDPYSEQNAHDRQFATKKLASSRSLHHVQWAIGIRPSALPAMPFRCRGLEPFVVMGAL